MLWMENIAKKGDEIDITLAIVQTGDRHFYRIITLGTVDELVKSLKEHNFPDIVYTFPKKFKVKCVEVEDDDPRA